MPVSTLLPPELVRESKRLCSVPGAIAPRAARLCEEDAGDTAKRHQIEVAERMGTTQSVVARLESGRRLPSIRTVERFARAVGGKLIVRIESARVVPQTSGAKRKLRMSPGYVLTLGYAADNDVWPVTLPA